MLDQQKIAEWKQMIQSNPQRMQEETAVITKYGTLFHPSNLDKLTKEEFKSFLLMKNNRHWEGIHRQGNIITTDMDKLKEALKILLDESRELKERLDTLFPPKGDGYIRGLGRAIVTPILMVVYPKKYGVYNSKSEQGLIEADLLPDFKRKSFAERYIEVNRILNDLAQESGITLWQLDEVIGCIALGNAPIGTSIQTSETCDISTPKIIDGEIIENEEDFGLESHLEDFIVDNWDKLDLSKKYNLREEDGEIRGIGQQFITEVGRFDLLAKSKDGKEWLVIELKKGRSSDAVVGQILRYITYTKKHLAKDDETVKGLIIVGEKDDKLIYSVEATNDIKLMTYKVSFKLEE